MKYLVRFGSNSKSEVVELNDDGLRFAKEAGYQIAAMDKPKEEKKEPTEAEMDEWFMGDGINMLDKLHNAANTQGKSFVLPHNQEELDALPNSNDNES